jgi:hypothetical protein
MSTSIEIIHQLEATTQQVFLGQITSYINITKNTYILSLTVTEIMGEKYGLLAVPRIVHFKRDASSLHCACPSL